MVVSELVLGLASLGAAVIGGVVGAHAQARLARRATAKHLRERVAIALLDEYHGMIASRREADLFLSQPGAFEALVSYTDPRGDHVSHVVHFFGKLAALRASGVADEELCRSFFSDHYGYWWSTHFHRFGDELWKHYDLRKMLALADWLPDARAQSGATKAPS